MLKITTHNHGAERVLKLEGKLLGDWIDELHHACRVSVATTEHLRLDLSELSFIDVAGTIALRELMRQGVSITTPSPFISELLKEY